MQNGNSTPAAKHIKPRARSSLGHSTNTNNNAKVRKASSASLEEIFRRHEHPHNINSGENGDEDLYNSRAQDNYTYTNEEADAGAALSEGEEIEDGEETLVRGEEVIEDEESPESKSLISTNPEIYEDYDEDYRNPAAHAHQQQQQEENSQSYQATAYSNSAYYPRRRIHARGSGYRYGGYSSNYSRSRRRRERGEKRQKKPRNKYQYILDILKPVVITALLVGTATFWLSAPKSSNKKGLEPAGGKRGRSGSAGSNSRRRGDSGRSNFDDDDTEQTPNIPDSCMMHPNEAGEMWRGWGPSRIGMERMRMGMGMMGMGDRDHRDGRGDIDRMRRSAGDDWTVTVTSTVTHGILGGPTPLFGEEGSIKNDELPVEGIVDPNTPSSSEATPILSTQSAVETSASVSPSSNMAVESGTASPTPTDKPSGTTSDPPHQIPELDMSSDEGNGDSNAEAVKGRDSHPYSIENWEFERKEKRGEALPRRETIIRKDGSGDGKKREEKKKSYWGYSGRW